MYLLALPVKHFNDWRGKSKNLQVIVVQFNVMNN